MIFSHILLSLCSSNFLSLLHLIGLLLYYEFIDFVFSSIQSATKLIKWFSLLLIMYVWLTEVLASFCIFYFFSTCYIHILISNIIYRTFSTSYLLIVDSSLSGLFLLTEFSPNYGSTFSSLFMPNDFFLIPDLLCFWVSEFLLFFFIVCRILFLLWLYYLQISLIFPGLFGKV